MKRVTREKVIFSFSSRHEPVERVRPSELVLLEAEDAFGGQVKDGLLAHCILRVPNQMIH